MKIANWNLKKAHHVYCSISWKNQFSDIRNNYIVTFKAQKSRNIGILILQSKLWNFYREN